MPLVRYPFFRFLVTLLVLLLVEPLAGGEEERGLTTQKAITSAAMTLILVFGTLAACTSRRQVAVGVCLAVLTLAAVWILPVLDEDPELAWTDRFFGLALGACPGLYYLFTAALTFRFALSAGPVTLERICAALCVYLLVGFAFSMGYAFIDDYFHQTSFRFAGPVVTSETAAPSISAVDPARFDAHWGDFIFFSFVTMTTLGYGDIVPVDNWARSLAVLQTVFAVFYLAVLIARLVGSYQEPSGPPHTVNRSD